MCDTLLRRFTDFLCFTQYFYLVESLCKYIITMEMSLMILSKIYLYNFQKKKLMLYNLISMIDMCWQFLPKVAKA